MTTFTRPFADRLEKLALDIRQDWRASHYASELRSTLEALADVDPDMLIGPLMRFCCDPGVKTPVQFKTKGPWWNGNPPRGAVPLRYQPPSEEERERQRINNAPVIERTKAELAAALSRTQSQPEEIQE